MNGSLPVTFPDILVFKPHIYCDARGYFFECFRQQENLPLFVQDNIASSCKDTLRGLHFQQGAGQAKLVQCLVGEIFDVVVDLRPTSATFGKWQSFLLDSASHHQLFIPVGFAHGYCVLSETALVHYKVSAFYDPQLETSIRWNDPDLQIPWPISKPILSIRDQTSLFFKEVFHAPMDHRG